VFAPNPVADLGIEALTDQKDADFFSADPTLRRAYHRVTVTDLASPTALSGAYVAVKSETGPAAANTGGGFIFTRDQDQFEQVMAYYWITQAQRYIRSRGFDGSTLRAVNRRQVAVRSTSSAATTRSSATRRPTSRSARAVSTTPRTRRSSSTSTGTRSRTCRCADSGRPPTRAPSARALWDIRQALGAKLADTIIIRAQFDFTADTSMPAAAARTIATAGLSGRAAQRAGTAAFAARGLA
jgi:hypothetical protein